MKWTIRKVADGYLVEDQDGTAKGTIVQVGSTWGVRMIVPRLNGRFVTPTEAFAYVRGIEACVRTYGEETRA